MTSNEKPIGARTLPLALVALLLVLAGCGEQPVPSRTPFVCHLRVPAEAGECIKQELEYGGVVPAAPQKTAGLTVAPQCVDVSVYQGVPNFTAGGVRCVIVQTNDGTFENRLFREQVRAAARAHIPWGVYAFLAPGESGEAQANLAYSMSQGLGRSLGIWGDAEVNGAYEHACSFTARLRALHVHLYGIYSSPGLWPGYRCRGLIWPAEWGTGPAYPLSGYPVSAIVLRQWCGTCTLAGFPGEVDRDESLGLISLGMSPPVESPAQERVRWHRELDSHYRLRAELRVLLDRHHCRLGSPWYGHAVPRNYHTACGIWLAAGQREARFILTFHAKGIF